MGKIMDFFTKNKNYVIAVIVLLLLIICGYINNPDLLYIGSLLK